MALAVLAAFGAAWLLGRATGAWRPVVLAAVIAGAIAEGWTVPIPTPELTLLAAPGEPEAYEYLRQSPPGGVLELPAGTLAASRTGLGDQILLELAGQEAR